ncbi:ACT domain-containing protein ACR4-like [Phalaenopsis equestris]|uniref:ACT domain-containing protein ACR4-like n=1 Tax=Phalaenopsis equestris TaxID=78828 RepID=UPI0009E4A40A|nr:ACT domain-containing protein ACR4-like [Phalaenopsis equestris]
MLQEYKDYEIGPPPLPVEGDQLSLSKLMDADRGFENVKKSSEQLCRPHLSIENWNDRDYLVINIKTHDRLKLMFDTICALTDMGYDVLHGFVSCHESVAFQEYFVRGMNEHIMFNEIEKQNMIRSLTAAVERRMSRGLKMEVHTFDRHGLLSVMSRKLRENNMSFKTAEFAKRWLFGHRNILYH